MAYKDRTSRKLDFDPDTYNGFIEIVCCGLSSTSIRQHLIKLASSDTQGMAGHIHPVQFKVNLRFKRLPHIIGVSPGRCPLNFPQQLCFCTREKGPQLFGNCNANIPTICTRFSPYSSRWIRSHRPSNRPVFWDTRCQIIDFKSTK